MTTNQEFVQKCPTVLSFALSFTTQSLKYPRKVTYLYDTALCTDQ